ncbi:MAG: ATP-binding protein [Geitlerinemataceae cyanobacterium]
MARRDILTEIYSSFEPFLPPPEGAYIDCRDVRGGWDVIKELGKRIERSSYPTCQLYTGHRGVGKSTELVRLKKHLEGRGYFVVYFAVDSGDIEPQDTEYADILLACTRHLIESIQLSAAENPLLNWMKERWKSLKELALTEVKFEDLKLEQQIAQFGKITANLRAVPDIRRKIRQELNQNTVSLIDAMNEFIVEAQKSLSAEYNGLVLMADSLDRIVEQTRETGNGKTATNYDEIFLTRSELLKGLKCHAIYTLPISMIYSHRFSQLEDNYSRPDVLPMIMVRDRSNKANPPGIEKLRKLVYKRIEVIDAELAQNLTTKVFDCPDTLDRMCCMSGGHVRILMQLMQGAIDQIDVLPITSDAMQIAIEEGRDVYRRSVYDREWKLLAQVAQTKQITIDDDHLHFLLDRYVLEYRYYDEKKRLQRWYDVHPLMEEIEKFQKALGNS